MKLPKIIIDGLMFMGCKMAIAYRIQEVRDAKHNLQKHFDNMNSQETWNSLVESNREKYAAFLKEANPKVKFMLLVAHQYIDLLQKDLNPPKDTMETIKEIQERVDKNIENLEQLIKDSNPTDPAP